MPRARAATVCEAVLLPGDGAVLAPAWVPWSERLRPGDIGPGDVLPFAADDPRLEPGYVPTGDEDEDRVAIEELALARARVLSPLRQGRGRRPLVRRHRAGRRRRPRSRRPRRAAAAGSWSGCIGSLGTVFGVCANEWSPDDGKVVSLDHGCGAHSETDAEPPPSDWPAPAPSIDELEVEIVSRIVAHAAAGAETDDARGDERGAGADAARPRRHRARTTRRAAADAERGRRRPTPSTPSPTPTPRSTSSPTRTPPSTPSRTRTPR